MAFIELKDLSFFYPNQTEAALSDLSFSVDEGEFLTLLGASGSGKTTLLRLLKPAMMPRGSVRGSIILPEFSDKSEQATKIGFVMQSPENQIVTDKVWHELAFGAENLGMEPSAIRRRVAEIAAFFGIESWFHKNTADLSGGQKQILNLASVMVMQPRILLLDEPTAQLDPIAAADFLNAVSRVHREFGITVIMSEHRTEEAFALSDRVLALENGRLLALGTPEETAKTLRERENALFLSLPTSMRLCGKPTVSQARQWLREHLQKNPALPLPVRSERESAETALEVKNVSFRYEKKEKDILHNASCRFFRGQMTAIMGSNGCGKTTLLKLLCGIQKPQEGKIQNPLRLRCALLPQDPKLLFTCETVRKELSESAKDKNAFSEIAALCRLERLLDRHPYDLSGGEMQRLALAKLLLSAPDILLLDEPTKGMDANGKRELAVILATLLSEGKTVIIVSHDVEFCAEYADRCVLLFDGAFTAEGSARAFFCGNTFYTTSANRIARDILPEAVTCGELLAACGVEEPDFFTDDDGRAIKNSAVRPEGSTDKKIPHSMWAAIAVSALLIPATILAGIFLLDGKRYLFISLLVLAEILIPFALLFEKRKPMAKELVLPAVLAALAVAGRAAFYALPNVKPVLALVILSGAALGGETGFLVGALSMLLSNIIFGQGPWTPWQMLAMGLCGFLAGVFCRKEFMRTRRLPLAVFGFASAVAVYGVIMNVSSAVTWYTELSWKTVFAYCAAGLPFDALHGASTAAFLWLLGKPMLKKFDRIRIKYDVL